MPADPCFLLLFACVAAYALVAAVYATRTAARCDRLEDANEALRQPCPRCAARRQEANGPESIFAEDDAVPVGECDTEGGDAD